MFEKKLEKVIAGLECCTGDQDASCEGNCPYFKGYYLDDCTDRLKADALEVLKGLRSKSGDLISRSALMDAMGHRQGCGCSCADCEKINCLMGEVIEEAPAVEAEPVVHAHWEIDKSFMPFISTCSKCGAVYDVDGAFDWKRCLICGAHMDEEVDE